MFYPLKFAPIFKETIWGGDKLNKLFNKQTPSDKVGESWELSDVKNNISVVTNGELAGKNLQQLLQEYKGDIVGTKNYQKYSDSFPLLFKLIDANDNLSIQVHPDDVMAMKRHNSFGKTEMWYVVDAEPGAELIAGFVKDSSPDEYMQAIKEGNVENLFQKVPVKKGDVLYIPAGLVHAIGKGIVIAEIQQTSDITYRIYDFNRTDANGNARELHINEALDVINYKADNEAKMSYKLTENENTVVVKSDFFTTGIMPFNKQVVKNYDSLDSFVVYMCIEGQFSIQYNENETLPVDKGETILIPAALKSVTLNPVGEATILEVYL